MYKLSFYIEIIFFFNKQKTKNIKYIETNVFILIYKYFYLYIFLYKCIYIFFIFILFIYFEKTLEISFLHNTIIIYSSI
jgi:hypothetical protein